MSRYFFVYKTDTSQKMLKNPFYFSFVYFGSHTSSSSEKKNLSQIQNELNLHSNSRTNSS